MLSVKKSIIFEKSKIIYSIFFRMLSNVLTRVYFVSNVSLIQKNLAKEANPKNILIVIRQHSRVMKTPRHHSQKKTQPKNWKFKSLSIVVVLISIKQIKSGQCNSFLSAG